MSRAPALSALWPAAWDLDAFQALERMQEFFPASRLTRYPLRFLRYWFVRHMIEDHARRCGRPVDVLEVGVDRGQMRVFMETGRSRPCNVVRQWHAVDVAADEPSLLRKGYSGCTSFDVERGAPDLAGRFDVIVFLHLLEHLREPEACLRAFLPRLRSGGIIVGGSPTLPKLVADLGFEARLRRRAGPFGHVSILSPERIELFAQSENLHLRFLSGSFLMRTTGFPIENSALWLKFNVAFGTLFPSLGSEVNFCLSRPGDSESSR